MHHRYSLQHLLSALVPCPLTLFVCALLVGLALVSVRSPRESYRAADFGANLPEEEDEISFDETPSPTGKTGAQSLQANAPHVAEMPVSCVSKPLRCCVAWQISEPSQIAVTVLMLTQPCCRQECCRQDSCQPGEWTQSGSHPGAESSS